MTTCFIAGDNCVYIWPIEELNKWIDEYNRTPFFSERKVFLAVAIVE